MTREDFDDLFAANEQNTNWLYSQGVLKEINDATFEAVKELSPSDWITKSAVDHAFEAAIADR